MIGHVEDFQKITKGDFTLRPDGELGAVDTAHGVFFGRLGGKEVAVKKHTHESRARHEADMLKLVSGVGMLAVKPYRVIPDNGMGAYLVTERMSNLMSGSSLPLADAIGNSSGPQVAVSDIARTLATMHGYGLSHGDAQIKNFGIIREKNPMTGRPAVVVYDTEKGGSDTMGHLKTAPYGHDLGSLVQSLAYKGFGGQNADQAADLVEEYVLNPYSAQAIEGGLPRCVARSSVEQAYGEFLDVSEKVKFASAHSGHYTNIHLS